MSYFSRVDLRDCIIGFICKRRGDTCSGRIVSFVYWDNIKAEVYYDIDTHCDNGFTDFNLKCAYLSLKFDRMSDVPESEKLNIPVNTMQEIVDACKKYIATKPTTERQLFRNVCTYISKDKDAEIERLKALLDQHKIAY